jgi:hypothetical protein
MITPKKVTKDRKPTMAAQDWRAARETLSKARNYKNAVDLQRAARTLRDSVVASLTVFTREES